MLAASSDSVYSDRNITEGGGLLCLGGLGDPFEGPLAGTKGGVLEAGGPLTGGDDGAMACPKTDAGGSLDKGEWGCLHSSDW